MHAYSSSSSSFFFFSFLPWQSKHKEDTSATHPLLLDEPKFEVHPFSLHAFSLPSIVVCFLFLSHVYLFLLHTLIAALFLPFYFLFFLFLGWSKALFCLSPHEWGSSYCYGHAIKGFFDGADIVAEAMASASVVAKGVPAKVIQYHIMYQYNII